jgi:hypothetical protein
MPARFASDQIMLRNVVQRAKASVVYRLLLGRWLIQSRFKDPSRLVNSFYKAALGRLPEPDALATRILQIQSGVPVEVLAEEFVTLPNFRLGRNWANSRPKLCHCAVS